ncbi:MAG: glycosyltransferase family 2 protein, partial [Gammaproteobacteria bacterium]
FLAHYRALGVPHFAFIDNGSSDGTRALLASQPDVTLFHAPGNYRDAAFGVAWQQAVLSRFCVGRWVLLVDADEFLVYPGCESTALPAFIAGRESRGADAIFTDLVDMYPAGALESSDLGRTAPFMAAPCFDRGPLLRWHLGGGRFSGAASYTSALRHRLAPDAEPNAFLSQKCALLRYAPWVRLGHGIHDVANVKPHPERVWLAHFKYHAAFAGKVREEIRRGQHFGAAREYRHYADILDSHRGFWTEGVSVRFEGSPSFSQHATRAAPPGPP